MQFKHCVIGVMATFGYVMSAFAVEVTLICKDVGQEMELCTRAVNAWSEKTGHTGKVVQGVRDTDQFYEQLVAQLERGDDSIDIYPVDVIWTGLTAKYFIDLKEHIPEEEIQQHFPVIIENNTVDARLIGMPWFTDAGLLFYRKDLLKKYDKPIPTTWEQLAETAAEIQREERKLDNPGLWGFVFQGAAYEGLTCDAVEWIASYGGGMILDKAGKVTVNNPQAVTALEMAASWVGTIAPPDVLAFHEEEARHAFTRGDAVFMRNWPYAWHLLQVDPNSPVSGRVGVSPLPKGGPQGKSASMLGGWQLAVNKYSKHPEVAADLVRYMTSEAVQKQRAVEASYAPTIKHLYSDSEVLMTNPSLIVKLRVVFDHVISRPSTPAREHYWSVSERFWDAVHETLSGNKTAAKSLEALERDLEKMLSE